MLAIRKNLYKKKLICTRSFKDNFHIHNQAPQCSHMNVYFIKLLIIIRFSKINYLAIVVVDKPRKLGGNLT